MRIRLTDILDLPPGSKLPAGFVHDCEADDCDVRFVGRKDAKYCTDRCSNRQAQRRFVARGPRP
jgi:hypothetical protein